MSIATTEQTLAHLAVSFPAASRVFQRHKLDFCCKGNRSLESACQGGSLDAESILAQILESNDDLQDWSQASVSELIDFVVERYHRPAVSELSDLLAMARRVENRHGDKEACPRGLAALLASWGEDLLSHMQKEERVLFPLLASGPGSQAAVPVQVMEAEHESHGEALAEVQRLTNGYRPPPAACATWRALYLRLETFERELMEHIALEQEVLFPRARSN